MAILDLSNVYAKVAWSKRHFDALNAEIDFWLKNNQHGVVLERNPDLTQYHIRARLGGEAPNFQKWSLMLGDSITNLRDSLDYLVTAIAFLPTSPRPDKRSKAAFLIQKSASDFADAARGKLISVPDAVRNAILSVQPFNRPPDPVFPPLLGVLADLANGNKHKLLNMVFTAPGASNIEFEITGGLKEDQPRITLDVGNIQDGSIICVLELARPNPYVKLKTARVEFQVSIKHGRNYGSISQTDTSAYDKLFHNLYAEVNSIINIVVSSV